MHVPVVMYDDQYNLRNKNENFRMKRQNFSGEQYIFKFLQVHAYS